MIVIYALLIGWGKATFLGKATPGRKTYWCNKDSGLQGHNQVQQWLWTGYQLPVTRNQ